MSNSAYDKLKQLCEKRRSVRRFEDRPVPKEDIERIKEIARLSPYASGKKSYEILVVDDKAVIEQLARTVEEYISKKAKDMREDYVDGFIKYAKSFTFFRDAPVLLIPVFRISKSVSIMIDDADCDLTLFERDNFTKSISCVTMLILLAVESLGLGACYMTGPLIVETKLAKIIKIKRGRNIGAIIPVGYPII